MPDSEMSAESLRIAKIEARRIVKAWMGKEGATIEGDLFMPIAQALTAASQQGIEWAIKICQQYGDRALENRLRSLSHNKD
jgi:hypothetical protein